MKKITQTEASLRQNCGCPLTRRSALTPLLPAKCAGHTLTRKLALRALLPAKFAGYPLTRKLALARSIACFAGCLLVSGAGKANVCSAAAYFSSVHIKKNVPWHILAPRAVACDSLHLRASAHLWHVSAFLCNRKFLGISCYIKKDHLHPAFQPDRVVFFLRTESRQPALIRSVPQCSPAIQGAGSSGYAR